MPRTPNLPDQLCGAPFLGAAAVSSGLLTKSMLRSSVWRRLLHGVYLHRDVPIDHGVWCQAVALVLPPGTAIGGSSAAYLWGLNMRPEARQTGTVSVVAPRDGWVRRAEHIEAHYTVLAPRDLTSIGGVPVTTPERTAFDLGRRLPRAEALTVLDGMLHRHLVRADHVREMALERFSWPGGAQLHELLSLADPRAESPMETRLRLLLRDAGVPPAVSQHEIRDVTGRLLGRADLAWPDAAVAAEYDGDQHRERARFRQDVARLNALRMAGWVVLRFTADDVLRCPSHVAATVSTALAEAADRGAAGGKPRRVG